MQEIIREIERCRVCDQDDWGEVMSFGQVPLANGLLEPATIYPDEPVYPLDVVVCRQCWLMTVKQVVDPVALFRNYVYVTSESDTMMRHMRQIVSWATDRAGLTEDSLVVEMGSNIGTQLRLFQEAGFRTVGVDPASNLAAVAEERGVETIPDFFGPAAAERIANRHGSAALVLGRQCFAHIDDVHEVLRGVERVLAPDGCLVIEVPYLVELLRYNQFDTIYHEHLSYFSLGTLGRLFNMHGMRIMDVKRASVHGGSVVVFATRRSQNGQPSSAVADLLASEERYGLSTERPYRELARRTRQVTTAIGGLVRDLTASGKRVAGYGAPSKGSALLMACGLGREEVEFCSDTTSLKHGRVLPGSHVPVVPPAQASAHPPDYYLLLAWNYADEILRKEREFLEQGGGFIIPIPEPRVVTLTSSFPLAD